MAAITASARPGAILKVTGATTSGISHETTYHWRGATIWPARARDKGRKKDGGGGRGGGLPRGEAKKNFLGEKKRGEKAADQKEAGGGRKKEKEKENRHERAAPNRRPLREAPILDDRDDE